jgi:5-methylcytosine-specific restriction endonuclease McrA
LRIIKCDVCGREVNAVDVYARLSYKTDIKVTTKTGKETIRRVTRNADFCSIDCFKKFNIEAEPVVHIEQTVQPTTQTFTCDVCGKQFKDEISLKIHKKLAHKG